MQLPRTILSVQRPPGAGPDRAPHATVPRQRGPLPGLLVSRGDQIARAVGGAVAAQLAEHGEIIGGERSRRLITMFESVVESAVAGRPDSERELERFRELGARAVHWRLPLIDLTAAFNVALAAAHRELWSMAPREDFVEMAEVSARCSRIAELARDACVEGYAGQRSQVTDARLARRLLAERLISGDWEADPAHPQAIGADVAPGYLALVCESAVDETGAVKVEEGLAGLRDALYVRDASMLTVLLPAENEADAIRAAHAAAELVDRISEFADGPVYATQAYRPGLANLPTSVDEARRMLPIVKAIPDAQVKPYRADDLLVELALAQQPSIRRRLAGVISPLDAGTGLRRTLEVLLACDLDRERAARELCIHRRTLYYRMDRIRKLSGIDPNTAHGIQLLRAALTCARMQEMEAAPAEP